MTGIYLHIPFCLKKCSYCDFVSGRATEETMHAYTKALIRQISAFPLCPADTLFVGGGTPTLLPVEDMAAIMEAVHRQFGLKNAECTIEANPATVTTFRPYREMGFNRVSIGMQSAHDKELQLLGRAHTAEDFFRTYEDAEKFFPNINVDIMFGIPGQTKESWQKTLDTVVSLAPSHVSAYSLILEEGTPLGDAPPTLPDDDTVADFYDMAVATLEKNGLPQYEISNFGRPCRHNEKYWAMEEYLGFGVAAHSFWKGSRLENTPSLTEYLENPFSQTVTPLSHDDLRSEYCFLALRTVKGIDLEDYTARFGGDLLKDHPIDRWIKGGFAKVEKNRFSLTKKGLAVSNQIMCEFL